MAGPISLRSERYPPPRLLRALFRLVLPLVNLRLVKQTAELAARRGLSPTPLKLTQSSIRPYPLGTQSGSIGLIGKGSHSTSSWMDWAKSWATSFCEVSSFQRRAKTSIRDKRIILLSPLAWTKQRGDDQDRSQLPCGPPQRARGGQYETVQMQ